MSKSCSRASDIRPTSRVGETEGVMTRLLASLRNVALLAASTTYIYGQSPLPSEYVYYDKTCNPASCYQICDGVGYFSCSMSVRGEWLNYNNNSSAYRVAATTLFSNGCTQPVTIDCEGSMIQSGRYGKGVQSLSTGYQGIGNIYLIKTYAVAYFSYESGYTIPVPIVPCK